MITVRSTANDSILADLGIVPGVKLIKVNGVEVCDRLDFDFMSAECELLLLFETAPGDRVELEIDSEDLVELDLVFEPDKPRSCTNKCIFCFIHQLPGGLRRSLYFKDEDYKLSFQLGNYITLTNLTDGDFERIERQRLSPLYVSVHTTDDRLRRRMLGNERIPPLLPQIRRLLDSGIELHTQIVLCPGWNDGEHMIRTISDLASLHPGVKSIAVVPVGLTKHRSNLPSLQPFTCEMAADVLERLVLFGDDFHDRHGKRFVYPSDELFLLAGIDIPTESFYDDFPQVEDGVGMVRKLMDSAVADDVILGRGLGLTIVTGRLVVDVLRSVLDGKWGMVDNLSYSIVAADNNFLGSQVTVSGLLSGNDILDSVSRSGNMGDCVIVPPNCLNDDGLFLDDLTLTDLSREIGRPIIQAEYCPRETLSKVRKELTL